MGGDANKCYVIFCITATNIRKNDHSTSCMLLFCGALINWQMKVLEGTDFSRVVIDVILVETNRRGIIAINKNEVLEFIVALGM